MEPDQEGVFTLELLHVADQEAGSAAVVDAPNLSGVLNALRAEDVADTTLTLSSGDAFIPGVFFDASEAVFGAGGVADVQIQNELGFQAVALGNHEFDFGTRTLSELITGQDVTDDGDDEEPDTVPQAIATFEAPALAGTDLAGQAFGGTDFPYLSGNLVFEPDAFLGPLEAEGAQAPLGGVVTSSTIVEQDGERFGIVGATTPTLSDISSPGDVAALPIEFDATPTEAQLDALAGEIQADVDQLLVAGVDKIVVLSHMQRLAIEEALAERLTGVDVIVAGGSNTRLVDETDRLRDGDSAQGTYPIFVDGADGSPTAIVNTDGSYKYVGRLVIAFDEQGEIIPESYDPAISGAYATDAQGVADLDAADDVDAEVQAIADAIGAQIEAAESNVFGTAEVFLNGNRSGTGEADDPDGVRTQETNLGNLTADANLAVARESDPDVVVSIKNGGGIRASIGETVVPPGGTEAVRSPNPALTNASGEVFKPQGGISQNDIQTTLAFNNGLTLLTLTRADLVEVLEFGVSALPDVAGQFPQVAGVEFAFDPAAPAGDRITEAAIVDEDGAVAAPLVQDGEIAGDPAEAFRIVTLSFLADGGDGYPFDTLGTDRVDLFDTDGDGVEDDVFTGDATFAADGTEQDALAEFLDDLDAPFAEADTGPEADGRIQNLDFREADILDGVEPPAPVSTVINEVLGSTTGDDSEYVELFGQAGASLDGLSMIVVEGEDDGQIGDVNLRVDLGPDDAIGENGFFLIANDTAAQTYGVTADLSIPENAIENGAYTVALVETSTLAGDVVTGEETVLDAVAVQGTAEATAFFDAPVLGPDGTFLPAGVGRVADGQDTDQASDFEILSFGNDPAVNTPTAGFSPGGGGGGEGSIDDAATLISAVQGTEDEAALLGETVVVEAIVTGDFQAGDGDAFRTLDGFFLQEEEADGDGDAATSEGIFVLDGETPAVDVEAGDLVRVLGTVVERFGKTTIEATEVRVEEAGAADPLALAVETELPAVEDREAIESMLVTVVEPLTFVESFDTEQFGEATLASDGPVFQFSQLNEPDQEANAAYQAEVEDRTILIDDGTDGRREDGDPILQPDGEPFAVDQGIRMGQDLEDVTAIVDFGFGEYRLRLPDSEPFDPVEETNPRPDAPEDVGSDFKVSAFNVLNYFTTLDADGATIDNGLSPRGAETEAEFERQSDKLVTAITALDADVVGLVEIENDFAGDDLAIAELTARLNEEAGTQRWNWVDPGVEFVGTDAIAVGFLYDQTTVELVGDAAILDDPSFLDPLDDQDDSNGDETPEGDSFNRAALAQTFREIETGGEFTAAVNHFKSKGSLTGAPEDEDQGDGAGRNDATREAASEALLDWLDTDPTGSGDPDRMILGDLNAYAQEDPIAVLEEGGYTDLARSFEGEDVASFRFSGQIGTLDYALANGSLTSQVTGADTWNINSDELVIFDYNEESTFGNPVLRPDDQGLFDGATAARASDHDPIVVGLDLDGEVGGPLVVAGTDGNDRLRGTEADEIIVAAGGNYDRTAGGGGSDVFVLGDREDRLDRLVVYDFDPATDAVSIGEGEVGASSVGDGFLFVTVEREGRDDLLILRGASDVTEVSFVDDPLAVA
jgi:predicted extracellular nuclease/2',3'-cyclic-nucleotide 2'-phosphodiesterase (5'-nucleotidase family)